MNQKRLYKILNRLQNCSLQLKKEGIIRSNNITADLGEYYVCKKLKLKQVKPINKGFDAVDSKGRKYEIKTRKARNEGYIVDLFASIKTTSTYDFLVLVSIDSYYRLDRIVLIPRKIARQYLKNKTKINYSNKLSEELGVKEYNYQ